MNKENIPVITDREKLYDKCENMEQLFDKYYLPLLDKHYSKIYELQQENKQLNNILTELEEWLKDVDIFQMNFIENKNHITPFKAVLDKIQELKEKYK